MRIGGRSVPLAGLSANHVAGLVGATLASGALVTVVYRATGLQCPMRAVGLACPGCGCGTAATEFLGGGLSAAMSVEPTATVLLLSIVLTGVLAGVALMVPRVRSGLGFHLVATAGVVNWIWQLSS